MIRSMTGFADKTLIITVGNDQKINTEVSLKSLNSRFFEVTCKLPSLLNCLETPIIKLLKQRLRRGHVYLTLHMNSRRFLQGAIEPDLNAIEGYLTSIKTVKERFSSISGDLNVHDLLTLPGIFATQEGTLDAHTKELIMKVVDDLITQLIEEQAKEGQELKRDIDRSTKIVEQEIVAIAAASKKLIEEQKIKVQNILKEVGVDEEEVSESRKNAMYAMLDKMDINEEIVRFTTHLKNLLAQFESNDPEKGKRLDFTLQELGREVNTIAAKCSDAVIGTMAINVKVELEKAREQIQNIV